MKKRILAILLAVVMLMGTLSLSFVQAVAFQYDTDGDGESFALEVTDATIQKTDTEVTVDVNFKENSGVWAWKFYLVYDKELTVGANSAFVKGEAFADYNPSSDTGLKDATHDIMLSSDIDYADSIANAGLEGNSDWLVTTIYSECADPGTWSTDVGTLCSVTFQIDPASTKSEYNVYAVPTTGGWCLREEPGHPNDDGSGFVEIYDPACIPGTITVESNDPKLVVSNAEITEGTATADFTISVENNPGIWGVVGYINYDEEMSLTALTTGELYAAADLAMNPFEDDFSALKDMVVANNKQAKKLYDAIGASYDGVRATFVYLEPTKYTNKTEDGTIINFTLDTSSLEAGTYEIAFYFDEYGVSDNNGEPVAFGATYGTLTVNACAHEYDAGVTVPATCTVPGTITKTCALCGGTDVTEIPALEHAFDAGVVTTPAECGVPGVKTYTCTRNCEEEGWQYTEEVPALYHNYVAGTPVAPTCTKQGYTTYTCDLCGDSYDADFTPALEHTFDDGVETTPAECEVPGVKTYTCTRDCGEEGWQYTEEIPALGHDKYVTGTSGTCGDVGVTHWGCTRCDWTDDVDGEVIVHNYEEVDGTLVGATCTVDGSVDMKCSICGDEYTEVLPALEHAFDDGVVAPAATCTVPGVKTYTCTRDCGEEGWQYTEEIPALEHAYDAGVVTTPAECEVPGVKTYTCTRDCGEEGWQYTEEIPALEHETTLVNEVPVKCTSDGYTGDEVCDICGATVNPGSVIPALEHAYDAGVVTTPAECEVPGVKTYTCTRDCGEEGWQYTEVIPALGHDWDAGVVTAPECEKEGYTTYTCNRCGTTDVRDIVPGLEHVEKVTVVAPKCGEEGYTVTLCDVCGKELSERSEITEALEHVYADVVTPATCEEKGYTTYTCTLCGDSYTDNFVDELGHKWDNGVVTTAPTTEAEGVKTFTCETCQATKTEAVEKLAAEKDEDNKEENKTEENKKPTSAQTGDNVMALVLIALVAAVSFAGVVVSKKKIFVRK